MSLVLLEVVVEALEALGGEGEGDSRGDVDLADINEVEDGVLKDLGPD